MKQSVSKVQTTITQETSTLRSSQFVCEDMVYLDFGIYTFADLKEKCGKELEVPKRFGAFIIVWTGSKETSCQIDLAFPSIEANKLVFIGPDRLSAFSLDIADDAYFIFFKSPFYERSSKDTCFLQNSPLFFDHTRIYSYTPMADNEILKRITMAQLQKAFIHGEGTLHYDLGRNIIEYIILRATIENHSFTTAHEPGEDAIIALKFRNLVQEFFLTEKGVQFYADRLYISPRKLSKATEKTYGKNAKQLINDKQIDESINKLLYTTLSIKEISALLGFSEENNFSAFFSKHIGLSPKEYRKTKSVNP